MLKLWGGDVCHVWGVKRERLAVELGVVKTRQNFGFPCSFFVLLFVCCAMARGDGGRHEHGGR